MDSFMEHQPQSALAMTITFTCEGQSVKSEGTDREKKAIGSKGDWYVTERDHTANPLNSGLLMQRTVLGNDQYP